MKIHTRSKLTQYLINIFKMRFLMRNCLKYAQQCQNGIFLENVSGNNGTLISYVDLPSIFCTEWKYGEFPNT